MKSGQKLQWLAAVRRILPGKLAAQAIAGALVDRMNSKTRRLNPSYQTLAHDIGVSTDTAKRAIRSLRAAGLVKIERPDGKGPRSSNYYTLNGGTHAPIKQKKGGHPCPHQNELMGANEGSEMGAPMPHESERMNPPSAFATGKSGEGVTGNSTDTDCCGSALGGRPPQSAPDGGDEGQNRVDIAAEREKLWRVLNGDPPSASATPGASPAGLQ